MRKKRFGYGSDTALSFFSIAVLSSSDLKFDASTGFMAAASLKVAERLGAEAKK